MLMNLLKESANNIYIVLCGVLLLAAIILHTDNQNLKKQLKQSTVNIKALSSELKESTDKSIMYELSIRQLSYLNDSITKALDDTRRELKIKDKSLKGLGYIKSVITKYDTVRYTDTIFIKNLSLDTVLQDKWYKLKVNLSYPNTLVISPTFRSEKHVVVSTVRETVDPPRKFFLFRWFQKKHTVINVDVVEQNPYIDNVKQRFIKIE